MKSIRAVYWLVLIIVIQVVANFIWLSIDKTPPAWDQAAHIRSVTLANNFFEGNSKFIDLVRSFGGYPPLIYIAGGVWASVFGVSIYSISFINTLFLIGGIIGVYKLAKLTCVDGTRPIYVENMALISAFVFSLFPVIYDISRNFLLDLPLLVFVVWGLYFWIKNKDVGILVMLILASLTKLNGFLYFVPIGLFYLWEARKSEKMVIRLVIGGLLYLLAVGWWWGINFQNIYQYLTGLAGSGEKLTDPMNLASPTTWVHYFRLFFLHQVGPILGIVAIASWFKIPKNSDNKKLVYWTVFVYVIFTIIKNKDFRFTMPLLPVVAVWIGVYLTHPLRKLLEYPPLTSRVKQIFVMIFIGYLFFQFVENSFGWPVKKPILGVTRTFLMGDVEWIGWDDYPVRSANGGLWPQKEIINDLEKLKVDTGKKSRILVLINKEEINDNNLGMYKELYSSDAFEVGSVGSRESFVNEDEIVSLLKEFDGVLVAEKLQEPAPFYGVNLEAYIQARDWVLAHPENFQLISQYKIFGNKDLFLMWIK